jgi:hypothetical protein
MAALCPPTLADGDVRVAGRAGFAASGELRSVTRMPGRREIYTVHSREIGGEPQP